MKEEIHAFAVAIAATNGHPNPHAYADSVLEHLGNPPAVPEPIPEPAPAESETTDPAPTTDPAAEAPAA